MSAGFVLDIAKTALSAQQYGLNVTGHNIANVNTDGYSRQRLVMEARLPTLYAGMFMGRGVDTEQVVRVTDQLIENQLMQENSSLMSSQEMENYLQILESFFSENSTTSISSLLADFWNLWHDLANNPTGIPERNALYEHSLLFAEQFNVLDADLAQMTTDLTNAARIGIQKINELIAEIADINDKVVGMELTAFANDFKDMRAAKISELAEYLDVKTFEQENGALTVVTSKGYPLVSGKTTFNLQMGGTDGNGVLWVGSQDATVDITNYVTSGKLGGWLDMRDEIVAKYKLDLDAMVKEFVWAVNQQHSQGSGLEALSTVTGTYAVSDTGEELGTQASGLNYDDKISDGTFNLWVYDSNGNLVGGKPNVIIIDADTGGTTLTSLSAAIDGIGNITSSITGDKLQVDAASGYTFAFSDDTSNVLAALGVNTLFTGTTAGGIGLNAKVGLNKNYIAAAQVYNNVGPAVAASGNSSTGTITTDGPYTGTVDATYYIEITGGNDETDAQFRWSTDQASWTAVDLAVDGNPYTLGADGVRVTFNAGSYAVGDTFTIATTKATDTYGASAAGDNANALAIADLQYASVAIAQWACDRTSGNTQGSVTTTIEGYYNAMAGSIGISSASISNTREFNAAMMSKLSQIRDSISAVSIDEEMTNLIKFQHAYAAAAKLISVSDEMLDVILQVR